MTRILHHHRAHIALLQNWGKKHPTIAKFLGLNRASLKTYPYYYEGPRCEVCSNPKCFPLGLILPNRTKKVVHFCLMHRRTMKGIYRAQCYDPEKT